MLAGLDAAAVSFHAVCRFFSHHAWTPTGSADAARLIVSRLLPPTRRSRWRSTTRCLPAGRRRRRVLDPRRLRAGPERARPRQPVDHHRIVVTVPFCSHPVCLPVLLRLWRGKAPPPWCSCKGTDFDSARAFPDRLVHAVGDAAYHGKALLVPVTTTTRLPANAALYAAAPPRTGKRGRPRSKAPGSAVPSTWPPPRSARRHHHQVLPQRDRRDRPHPQHLVRRLRQHARPHRPGPRARRRPRAGGLHHRHRQLHLRGRRRDAHRWPIETAIASANNCSASARPATACSAPWNAPCR